MTRYLLGILISAVITMAGSGAIRAQGHDFYRQAPLLDAPVADGRLAPVAERLPDNPLMLDPVEAVGEYGGTWRLAMRRTRDHALLIRTIGYEPLVRWTPQWTGVVPNVAQAVRVNDDATEFEFTLRRGMRWSDGAPFTADDIVFWYEDILSNPALTPAPPSWVVAGDQPVRVEKIDDYTVKFVFSRPYGLFLQVLARPEGVEPTSYPKHFLARYLPKYNPDLDTMVKQAGEESWVSLFVRTFGEPGSIDDASRWRNPAVPTLNAWVLKNGYGSAAQLEAVRNPYYWKIDPAGQQLPYIDRLRYQVVENKRAAADLAIAGKVDMQARHVSKYVPDILGKSDHLTTFELIEADMNHMIWSLNLTHRDPILREIFSNRDFRIALSYAIDRRRVVAAIFGEGTPHQAAPRPESPLYHDRLARQFIEYNVDKAREHLRRAGLVDRDREGFVLRPDGRRLRFTIDTVGEYRARALEMMAEYWAAIGVEVAVRDLPRDEFREMRRNNDHDASAWGGDGGLAVMLYPMHYFPWFEESYFAVPWAYWYMNPNDPRAEEPPAAVKRQMALYDQLKASGDAAEQMALMRQVLDISADQFYVMGLALPRNRYGVKLRGLRNVPRVMPAAWTYPTPAPTNPAQYFMTSKEGQ